MNTLHPREVLLPAQSRSGLLPVCDHYSGVHARMQKSLQLQAEMMDELGACVFDVTLDCEDGAPAGAEAEHAALVADLALTAREHARVGARVHAVDHPSFEADVHAIVGRAGHKLSHLMIPKVENVQDVERAVAAVNAAGAPDLPLHVLIESGAAVHAAFEIAAHSRVQSLSFGLMDFVSSHAGAIPERGMQVQGQFEHPLVVRAKLELSAACHAHGKVPSHCVITEFSDPALVQQAAARAAWEFGYTRMWSIHPSQIRPILKAFAPRADEIETALEILLLAQQAQWAPISHAGRLHDRASYRYFWHVLERAHQTGTPMPQQAWAYFSSPTGV